MTKILSPDTAKKTGGDDIAPKMLKTTTIEMNKDHVFQAVAEYLYRYYGTVEVEAMAETVDGYIVRFHA